MKITKLTREQLSKNSYEVQIGEVIEIDGNQYTPIEDCTACPFRNDEVLCRNLTCTSCSRKDEKSVYFIKVNI